MRNIFIIFNFVLLFQNGFSQNQRKTVYLNQNNEEVTKSQFDSIDKKKVYLRKNKTDTLITHKYIYRKNYGELNPTQQKRVNQLLKSTIGNSFDENKYTMIHFFDEESKALKKGMKNEKYWSWIKRNSNRFQAFFIASKTVGIKKNKQRQLYIDTTNKIRDVFFFNSDFKINHVFIQPNGKIIVFYGNDNILYILDASV
ncbi:hypothetical protein [Pontimicrobium sp. MEBiC06410]|jgi:hypothetical protein